MRPMLDDLALPNVQEIRSQDYRILAEHQPAGMEGSLFQNMGRRPTSLILWGIATDPEALDFVEALNSLFAANQPIAFIGDILADAEIEKVIIDKLVWREVAGKPSHYLYLLDLREFKQPLLPAGTRPADLLDSEILNQVLADLNLGFEVVDLLSEFIPVLTDFNGAVQRDGLSALM